MKLIVAGGAADGLPTAPEEVRRRLGVAPVAAVAFVIEDDGLCLRPARFRLETAFGAVEPFARWPADALDRPIEDPAEEAAERRVRQWGLR